MRCVCVKRCANDLVSSHYNKCIYKLTHSNVTQPPPSANTTPTTDNKQHSRFRDRLFDSQTNSCASFERRKIYCVLTLQPIAQLYMPNGVIYVDVIWSQSQRRSSWQFKLNYIQFTYSKMYVFIASEGIYRPMFDSLTTIDDDDWRLATQRTIPGPRSLQSIRLRCILWPGALLSCISYSKPHQLLFQSNVDPSRAHSPKATRLYYIYTCLSSSSLGAPVIGTHRARRVQ